MTSPGRGRFDPNNTAAIREKLRSYLAPRIGDLEVVEGPDRYTAGMDTYVYAVRFAGDIPPEWSAPLVLRVYPAPEQAVKAQREADSQRFVSGLGFPAPRPLLVDASAGMFGLPLMLMERVRGRNAVDRLKNPLRIRSTVRAMAALHARLHSLPTEGCPLPYDSPFVDRWLAPSRDLVQRFQPPGLAGPLAWLEENAALVRDEEVALLHNDFHPLNIIVEGECMTLLDWSDAALGDRHSDVARTLALMWLAAPLEKSFLGRTMLGALRGYIVPLYAREYRAHLPLDDRRLRYWEALHAFSSWTQIATMGQEGEDALGARPGVLAEIPPSILPALRDYFASRVKALA